MNDTSAALNQARTNGRGQSAEVIQLQAVLSQQQATYSQLLQSMDQLQLDQSRAVDQVRIVEPADVPTRPVRPNLPLNVALAALVGLLGGIGLAVLIEYLDDTVKAPEDAEAATGLVPLGAITRIASSSGKRSLLGEDMAHSPVAEAYRILRTNIDFARVGNPGKTLLVTSTTEGEGKTTTISNLAVIVAHSGRRVIIVDADLRRPSVHKMFGIANAAGLTNLLLDETPVAASSLQPTAVPNLWVLPCGPIPPNPSELLVSYRMERILNQLGEQADVVLVDTPPVLAVADPTILAARADGVILVVEAGRTRVGALRQAKERLTRGSARMLGVVVNKLGSRQAGYQYSYYNYETPRERAPVGTAGRQCQDVARGQHRESDGGLSR